MPRKIQRYGWKPDLPDHRDYLFAVPYKTLRTLSAGVDLTPQCPPVYDQGQLGSCTANAIAAAIQFDQMRQQLPSIFTPSRLFIYYNERVIEGDVSCDNGAQIRDGMKSVASQGVCPESMWPYDLAKWEEQPADACYQTASQHPAVIYQSLNQDLTQLKGCLASGYPFVFGFSVYESFESPDVAQTGHVPLPSPQEQMIGGHAVMAVGYDDSQQWFIVRNSWGTNWGMLGYFTLPYAYLLQSSLASDFWTIQVVK
jgi:C1A family cysteine protease